MTDSRTILITGATDGLGRALARPATYMPTKMVLEEVGHSIDALDDGVAATYRLISDPPLAGVTGRFFDRTREARAHRQAYDPAARKELWNRSLQLTGAVADQGQ
jgi:hypothetical protein